MPVTLQRDSGMLLRLQFLIVTMLMTVTSAQNTCHRMSPGLDLITYSCLIQTSSDLHDIPLDTQSLDIRLTFDHDLNFTVTSLPHRASLISLTIDVTNIEVLEAGMFSSSYDLITLYLYQTAMFDLSSSVVQLKADVFSSLTSLTTLHLVELGFTSLPQHVFRGLSSLTYLDLNHNDINSLSDDVFTGLQNLRTLSLARNDISDLSRISFKHLHNLRNLNLLGNNINILKANSFATLSSLEELSVIGNNLLEVEAGALDGLVNLKSLYLDQNNMTRITQDILRDVSNLSSVLSLSYNRLTQLHPQVFSALTDVQQISMAHNNIHSLPADVFSGLTRLHTIDLSNNDITALEPPVFKDLKSLQSLYLEENSINDFEKATFSGLTQLENLNMSHNQVEDLYEGVFDDLVSLTELDLSGNPLNCSCGIFWLQSWLSGHQRSTLMNAGGMICHTPAQVENLTFFQVHADNTLECDEPPVQTSEAASDLEVTTHSINTSITSHQHNTSGLNNAAKGGIVAAIFILAILVVAGTAFAIHNRQKRYNWSPNKDMDDDDRRMRLFYYARHKIPRVYRDPETGRIISIQDNQQKPVSKKNKKNGKIPKVIIKKEVNPISEDDESKTPDSATVINNNNKPLSRPRHLDFDNDMDYKFEIDVDTPRGVSPLALQTSLKSLTDDVSRDKDSGFSHTPDLSPQPVQYDMEDFDVAGFTGKDSFSSDCYFNKDAPLAVSESTPSSSSSANNSPINSHHNISDSQTASTAADLTPNQEIRSDERSRSHDDVEAHEMHLMN